MYFKSIDDLNRDIIKNLYKIPRDVDVIVGVPRSGLLVANLISLYLNLPLSDLDSFLEGRIMESGKTRRRDDYKEIMSGYKKILVVEDSVASGQSMIEVKEKIRNANIHNVEYIYFAAYVAPNKKKLVDIYLDICNFPRVFEWNIMHHSIVERSCFDLDGVLCIDPNQEEDDDGERYIKFLKDVKPIFIPTKPINYIVTCRIEKYRKETEEWLKKHGIRYNNLVMMDYKSKSERMKCGKHSEYKAENYKKTKSDLFIESSLNQAIDISRISKKPVYCIETRSMIYPNCKTQQLNYYGSASRILGVKIKFKNKIMKLIPRRLKIRIKGFLNI